MGVNAIVPVRPLPPYLESRRDNELTNLLGWPGYRVHLHEIDENAETLKWSWRPRNIADARCSRVQRKHLPDRRAAQPVARTPTRDANTSTDLDLPDLNALRGTSAVIRPRKRRPSQHRSRTIYASKCAKCHGATGKEGGRQFPVLVGPNRIERFPFATTIWDYINTAMPRQLPSIGLKDGTLTADEVYALTAFLLARNGIIQEGDVMDPKTLPRVRMPKRDPHLDRLAPR